MLYMGNININTLEVIEGDLPNKALMLAKEWIKINELYNNSYKEKNKRNLRLFLFFYI